MTKASPSEPCLIFLINQIMFLKQVIVISVNQTYFIMTKPPPFNAKVFTALNNVTKWDKLITWREMNSKQNVFAIVNFSNTNQNQSLCLKIGFKVVFYMWTIFMKQIGICMIFFYYTFCGYIMLRTCFKIWLFICKIHQRTKNG